jgi:hypothetical protein
MMLRYLSNPMFGFVAMYGFLGACTGIVTLPESTGAAGSSETGLLRHRGNPGSGGAGGADVRGTGGMQVTRSGGAFGGGGNTGAGGADVRGTGGTQATRSGGAFGGGGNAGTALGTTGGAGGSRAAGTGGARASATGGDTGTVGLRAYRPFNDTSPWNTAIGPNPDLEPTSQALIDDLAASTPSWNFLGINLATYSIPVYYIDSNTTPTYMVTTGVSGHGFDKPVPIPDGALPDPQSDRHLSIVDKTKGIEWGMWDTVRNAQNQWSAGVGASSDLTGSGVRPPITTANPWTDAMGSRASGFPLIAGLIRVEEVKAGKIEHALVLAYPHCRSRYFVPPASTAQGTTSDALPNRGIPMGGHVQLDPAIDVESLPLTATGKIVAHALQDYGAFIGDFSGAINLYAEGSPDAQAMWASGGLLQTYEIRDVFNQAMLRRLRVLRMPAFLDNNN